jgi:DNA-binding IclR family transcriptional regulator
MLQGLVKHDFLRKDELTKVYRLGPALLLLGADSLHQWDLPSIALPHLQQLVKTANETVILTRLYRDRAICLQTIESERSFQYFVRPGREIPFNSGAAAKAILAHQSDEEIERILSRTQLLRYTPQTIIDVDELKEHLRTVRRQGYAFCDGELEVGMRAIAAPIMPDQQRAVGSVAVVAPAERLDAEARKRLVPALLHSAQQVSKQLGARLVPLVADAV